MSKTLVFLFISSLLLFNAAPSPKNNYAFGKPVATCYGNSPCKACSNCSGCKYCNNGGSCDICAKPKTKSTNNFSSAKSTITSSNVYVGQCKGLTKKGARCKRSGGGNGYCWQH
ncbi:MAG: hypothetical protein EOP54_14570 [Sphingobacteriales bacterium]|nr:MAG: hypothetical protein EOP54_14570 [Sphingobacteriales bacterium]